MEFVIPDNLSEIRPTQQFLRKFLQKLLLVCIHDFDFGFPQKLLLDSLQSCLRNLFRISCLVSLKSSFWEPSRRSGNLLGVPSGNPLEFPFGDSLGALSWNPLRGSSGNPPEFPSGCPTRITSGNLSGKDFSSKLKLFSLLWEYFNVFFILSGSGNLLGVFLSILQKFLLGIFKEFLLTIFLNESYRSSFCESFETVFCESSKVLFLFCEFSRSSYWKSTIRSL